MFNSPPNNSSARQIRQPEWDLDGRSELMVQYVVMKSDKQTCRQNARVAAQIMVSGITLMRQNIRRRHPGASESEIDHLFHCWLSRSDDGIPGDVAGSVRIREAVR